MQNLNVTKPVYNITPFTLLDYPDKTACVIWFAGCNMRCVYCYNPDIVLGKGKISLEEVLAFLKSRKGLLDGIVLSGGECMAHKYLFEFLSKVKRLNFFVKIDTNGSYPKKLENLIQHKLVDYVALDFKSEKNKFSQITKSNLFEPFSHTLKKLVSLKFPFEVRTTVHSELLQPKNLEHMIEFLRSAGYRNNYYLQYFRNNSNTLTNLGNSTPNYLNHLNNQSLPFKIIFRNEY